MLQQRNAFINEMSNIFASQKKKFHDILNKCGWTPQSVAGPLKEKSGEEENYEHSILNRNNNEKGDPKDRKKIVEEDRFDGLQIQDDCKVIEGTSKDSEKRYNELLASLSFHPKMKQEKLSDTQLLASLLEAERNAKRRRISYRNKVHTKNKTHTEVLREVIREQMEVLKGDGEDSQNMEAHGANEKKDEDNEMVEIRVVDGNPHLAWQTVRIVADEQQQKVNERLSKEKSNLNHRRSPKLSNSEQHNYDKSREKRHRKHSDQTRSSPKRRRRSSPYHHKTNSPDYHRSRHSRSDRSRERQHSKNSHRSSSSSHRHNSRHLRTDR